MRSSWLGGILIIVVLGAAAWFLSEMSDILSDMTFSDFTIYYHAAEKAKADLPIYDIEGITISPQSKSGLHPECSSP